MSKSSKEHLTSREALLALTGSIDNKTADHLQKTIQEEFNKIEGKG